MVGYAYTADGSHHAFLYSGGTMKDLDGMSGSASWAYCVNNKGQVVGDRTVNSVGYAFLYTDGIMQDLNSLIPTSSEWELGHASSINDNGWIVGWGMNPSGQQHAFLLTPVPEPSTLVLLGAAAIGLLGYAWRRKR